MSERESASVSARGIDPLPTLFLRAYGRTIAFSGPAQAMAIVRELLPPSFRIDSGPAERRWTVHQLSGTEWAAAVENDVLSVRGSVVEAADAVLSDLEIWVAEHARNRVFVHAGCVAVDGRAIVLPGRSMSGKSSLTAALVRAGAEYYSDEYAVLDRKGLVRPYPRKLAMRPYDGGRTLRTAVEELGGRSGRGPAEVKLIALLRIDTEAGWRVDPISRGLAVIRILDNTVAARSRPQAALSALESATEDARAFEGTRGDADETAARLLSMLTT